MSKRKGIDLTGVFLLNKDKGISSNRALQQIKRLYNAKKAGHTGSLDPMATGLLPICFGKATKICQYLLDSDKTYEATIKLGIKTDTGDAEGNIIEQNDMVEFSEKAIDKALNKFLGDIQQVPPMHSALKRDGVPLYKLARKGIEVERKPRNVNIYSLERLDYSAVLHELKISVKCSKGTYIRTLAEDIANELGVYAHLIALNRTACGLYNLDDSYQYFPIKDTDANLDYIIPVESAFNDKEILYINLDNYTKFIKTGTLICDIPKESGVYRLYIKSNENNKFLGVVNFESGKLLNRQLFI